jgi:hypothetical protein
MVVVLVRDEDHACFWTPLAQFVGIEIDGLWAIDPKGVVTQPVNPLQHCSPSLCWSESYFVTTHLLLLDDNFEYEEKRSDSIQQLCAGQRPRLYLNDAVSKAQGRKSGHR